MYKIYSPRMILAALGLGLVVGACERTDNTVRSTPEAEREATNAAREARAASQEAARAAERAAEAARQAATPPPAAVPTTTMAFSDALGSIAEARCEREQRCDRIGAGKRYESLQVCRTVVRNDLSSRLNPADCNRGIDRSELSECMAEARNEDCGNPIDTLERIVACRASDLCRNTSVSMR